MPVYQNKGTYLFIEVSEPYSLHLLLNIVQELPIVVKKKMYIR